ncbi:MAG: hypothetical protein ACP5JX_04165 [Sulfurihydrogenibium sp.]
MKYLTGRTSFYGVKGGISNFSFQKNLYVYYKKGLGDVYDVARFVIRGFIFFRAVRTNRKLYKKIYY